MRTRRYAFSRRLLILMEISLFSLLPLCPAHSRLFLLFSPFFFVFFIHVKFLRSRFSLLRVLSVSRIQTNVYVWVPISIKTFPRRAAANHLSPFTISSPTSALRTSVNPSHPRLLFSRRTYFINARPLLTVAPLDDR